MKGLTGDLALRATAWLVALGFAFLLWHQAGTLNTLVSCWPFDPNAQAWRIDGLLAWIAVALSIAFPFSATVFSGRAPRVSAMLAASAIVLAPLLYLVLAQSAPEWPR